MMREILRGALVIVLIVLILLIAGIVLVMSSGRKAAGGSVKQVCSRPAFIDPWYNSAERRAIEKAVAVVHPLDDTIRVIDPASGGKLPYRAFKGQAFRTSLHAGQRKLYLSELDLLTRALKGERADAPITVVYAGAAPSHHTPYLSAKFPGADWHLYDPAEFGIKPGDRIHLYNEFFTDDTALRWAGRCDLFICDIRLHPDRQDVGAREAFESQVEKDMAMQAEWVRLIAPRLSMLKFRLPYAAKRVKYLAGDVHAQAFAPQASTEGRLITDGRSETTYDSQAFEEWFYYHNTISRDWAFYDHGVRAKGLDHCADCALEVMMQRDYLQLRLGRAPTDVEIGAEIDALTHHLQQFGLKGLAFEAHGIDPKTPMCDKRKRLYDRFFKHHHQSR